MPVNIPNTTLVPVYNNVYDCLCCLYLPLSLSFMLLTLFTLIVYIVYISIILHHFASFVFLSCFWLISLHFHQLLV